MIPYPSVLEFFVLFYETLPVSFRAFIFTVLFVLLVVAFLTWFIPNILG